ncbi:transcriptional regulator [Clostridiaceae bacterium 35-E11]
MLFSEKLNLLMNINNTTNSSLARSISLDASYISRLRRGIRRPAKNENYLKSIAAYFSKNCNVDYQKDAICKVLNIPSKKLLEDPEDFTELIYRWFLEKEENKEPITNFIEDVAHFKFNKANLNLAIDDVNIPEPPLTTNEVFYGIEGKQNAVISFLLQVLKNKIPQTLLLYSDEDMEWLTRNREFTLKWASLLSRVIMQGNRIKIIHTVNRNLDEILSAIKEWLPLYMTGFIEPYYYPKVRDGVFKRTLFIAPDTVAVASSSVGNKENNAANFLYRDKTTIKSLIEEYHNYLSLCRPLMKIFTTANKENYLSALTDFESEAGHSILKTNLLSSITMPMAVAESVLSSTNHNTKDQILSYHKIRTAHFENNLKKHKFTEIITIPDINTIQERSIKINFSDMLSNTQLFYKPEDFILHLQNVVRLMNTYEHYNVYIASSSKSTDYMLYIKEDLGIIVAKTSLPSVVFAINESNMTAAFWDYMKGMLGKIERSKSQRTTIVDTLTGIIKKLQGLKI